MSAGAVAAATARRAERRIIERLRDAGATTSAEPCPLDGLRRIEARRLRGLVASGAVLEPKPGLYSFDESAYESYRGRRRTRVMIILAVVAAAGAAAWWISSRG